MILKIEDILATIYSDKQDRRASRNEKELLISQVIMIWLMETIRPYSNLLMVLWENEMFLQDSAVISKISRSTAVQKSKERTYARASFVASLPAQDAASSIPLCTIYHGKEAIKKKYSFD